LTLATGARGDDQLDATPDEAATNRATIRSALPPGPEPLTPALPGHSRRIPLIVAAAMFMETLDASIIVTALPSIARSFGETTLALSIGISAYLVAVAVFVPAAGWVSDRYGARNVFACAVGGFTLASLLCGLSTSLPMFVIARVLQGSAAAFMSPVGRLVVLRETPKHRIIESLGLIVWPALIGPVVGPPLGGLIATYATWHWIFFINLPIGLLGLYLVLRYIPVHAAMAPQPFDARGFVYTGGALVAVIQGLAMLGEAGGQRWAGLALLVLGLLAGLYALRHARRHPSPLLDLQAARTPTFVISTLTAGLIGRVAINATPFLLPLMFQIGFGDSAFKAGLMLLVYMGGNLAMKAFTTQLLRRFGFRTILVSNGLLGAAAIAACGFLTPQWPLAFACLVLCAAGMTRSMQFTAVNTVGFADIPAAARAGATTMSAMAQQVGLALGVAFATMMLALVQTVDAVPHLTLGDFHIALWATGALMAVSAFWTLRLPHDAGNEATGAQPAGAAPGR
jgi:EmrB/QacA subfamily drug resistance transporter